MGYQDASTRHSASTSPGASGTASGIGASEKAAAILPIRSEHDPATAHFLDMSSSVHWYALKLLMIALVALTGCATVGTDEIAEMGNAAAPSPSGSYTGRPRPWLGLRVEDRPASNDPFRIVVARVDSNGPADEAGFEVGDLIRAANRKPVYKADEVAEISRGLSVNDTIPFIVMRGTEHLTLDLVVGER
jgi:hypothetical protein